MVMNWNSSLIMIFFYFKTSFLPWDIFSLLGIPSAPHPANPGVYLDFVFQFGQVFHRVHPDHSAVLLATLRIFGIRSVEEIWSCFPQEGCAGCSVASSPSAR